MKRALWRLLGFASGGDADRRVERVAEEGLALACETAQDWIAVDVAGSRGS